MAVDRIKVNEALTALLGSFGASIQPDRDHESWDERLNNLTHAIADTIDAVDSDPALPAQSAFLTPEQLRAVLEFAERGISQELGAIDPRMPHTPEELADMRSRFNNAHTGIKVLKGRGVIRVPLMPIPVYELDALVLIYRDDDGNTYEQPAGELTSAGTLIDPESGDDLELIGWRLLGTITQKG